MRETASGNMSQWLRGVGWAGGRVGEGVGGWVGVWAGRGVGECRKEREGGGRRGLEGKG